MKAASLSRGSYNEEEVPLLIQDFSCSNCFETVVDAIERYLLDIFATEELLQDLLYREPPTHVYGSSDDVVVAAAAGTAVEATSALSSSSSSSLSTAHSLHSEGGDEGGEAQQQDTITSGSPPSQGMIPSMVMAASVGVSGEARVWGRNFKLGKQHRRGTGGGESAGDSSSTMVNVEIHLFDYHHPIAKQFYLPLFFLIQGAAAHPTYTEREANYLLSLLVTAVGNVFGPSGRLVLDITSAASRRGLSSVVPLSSPLFYARGCAPCFVPLGDAFQQVFSGLAPTAIAPLDGNGACTTTSAAVGHHSDSEDTASWSSSSSRTSAGADRLVPSQQSQPPSRLAVALGQPVFACQFLHHVFPQAPEECRCVSDYIDLFQLYIGQHSRLHSDDEVDGMCVSVSKKYELTIPWRFPSTNPAHSEGLTWSAILELENSNQRILCGPCTYPFGCTSAPLQKIECDVQWNQLTDFEAQENASRSYLNPLADISSGAHNGSDKANAAVPTVTERVRAKSAVIARAVPLEEARIRHIVCDRVSPIVDVILKNIKSILCSSSRDIADVELSEGQRQVAFSIVDACVSQETRERHGMLLRKISASPCSKNEGAMPIHSPVSRYLFNDAFRSQQKSQGVANGVGRDVRWGYFPGSLPSRFAYTMADYMVADSHSGGGADDGGTLRPGTVLGIWRAAVSHLRTRVERGGGNDGIAFALASIGLPANSGANVDCVVDVAQPLLVQKVQFLAYCLRELLRRPVLGATATSGVASEHATQKNVPTDGWEENDDAGNGGNLLDALGEPFCDDDFGSDVGNGGQVWGEARLISNHEPLMSPPSFTPPPSTTDMLLERASELRSLGAGSTAQLTRSWLQSDTLYNDMCLFLYANRAQDRRVVRFPDFIQWHSPRDFVQPPPHADRADDNAFLSERMQNHEGDSGNSDDGAKTAHVWWALWARATPRSLAQVTKESFRPYEQAVLTLRWLEKNVTAEMLMITIAGATIANAAHRLLSHPLIAGSDEEVVPALHTYAQSVMHSLTCDVERASAILLAPHPWEDAGTPFIDVADVETSRNLFATAVRKLGEVETAISVGLAVHHLLGVSPSSSQLLPQTTQPLARALSSPAFRQTDPTCLTLEQSVADMASWMPVFTTRLSPLHDPVETVVRLTCMAERPLGTANCFQQLVVHHNNCGVLRCALALTQEVL